MEESRSRMPCKLSRLVKCRSILLEWVLPGLFALILLACLTHLGYCALQGLLMPDGGVNYAISAFVN